MRDNSQNRVQVSRVLNRPSCLDGCVREKFDLMTADEFAGYVAENPLDSPSIFYYMSISSQQRATELLEGFTRHPYFNQEPCRCHGRPRSPILNLLSYDNHPIPGEPDSARAGVV